ncbi:epimerase [Shimia sp.]|uniref:epimerase n=1 Tax=Shimia sp. TaxID=1954381 RepID=UPI0032982E9D
MKQTVLILGASGRFGRHAATAFGDAGWTVRRFNRATDTLPDAVRGVQVIVNGWNPPYTEWAATLPDLHASVIAAAKSVDALVIVPGNVYVYGPANPGVWSLTTPHDATNPLGRIRQDMERAYRDSGVRTILLRGGDFIDTQASGNWFDKIMAPKVGRGVFTYPGNPGIPHAWAYLPDMARAAVLLAGMPDNLNTFEEVPFPGYTLTGRDIAQHLGEITGQPMRVKRMDWLPLRLLTPFWKLARHLQEMRYLWNTPHALDDARLRALLPDFEPTPVAQALARAIPQDVIAPTRRSQNSRSAQTIR